MHGLSIFCHFWQIADHTHIFSLPLPHKLWLHMGKHSLPQECNKLQPMPRTHSRDSPMEFPPMVSNPSALAVTLPSGHTCTCESFTGVVLKDGPLGPLEKGWSPFVSKFLKWSFLMSIVRTGSYLSWGQRWQIPWVHVPSCSCFGFFFFFPFISQFLICHLSTWLWNPKYFGAYFW